MRSEPAFVDAEPEARLTVDTTGGTVFSVNPHVLCLLLGLAWAIAAVASAIAQTTATPSAVQGIYTEEQALRGQTLYNEHCLECHGETMTGLDQAPPLVGPQFSGTWDGEPLSALVDRIGTMPPARPGSLTRTESVDILAYILWYNGLPIGETQLDPAQGALGEVTFQTPALSNQ